MKKFFLLILVIFSVLPAFAYDGTTIGSEVSELNGKKLQWGAGQFDYFVMFKSLMANTNRETCTDGSAVGCDYSDNPEPDTCLESSTFELTNRHIPDDAYIEAAYLVWTVSVDPNNIHTDNTATLNFTSDDGRINETVNVTAPRIGTAGTDANPGKQDFTFEGIAIESDGTVEGGYYTYRVDVTDFFRMIHNDGRNLGYASDGFSLYGKYTVSDIDCTDNQLYLSKIIDYVGYSGSVMGGWSLITVYRSTRVTQKMVYLYNGFGRFCKQEVNIGISGFEFPDKPKIKMTFAVNEGDPGIAVATDNDCPDGVCPPEGLRAKGEKTPEDSEVFLFNSCNPAVNKNYSYTEMYNGISSFYGWDDQIETCIGGDPNAPNPDTLEYTMDVDTFLLDAEANEFFNEQFRKGDTSMTIKVGANGDCVYPNFLIVSVDTQKRGEAGGECYENGTCNEGLECDIGHNICIEPETDDTDTDISDTGSDDDTSDTGSGNDTDSGTTDPDDGNAGSSDSSHEKGNMGELNGECYPNGTCNEGLACSKNNVCTKLLVLKNSGGGCSLLTVD